MGKHAAITIISKNYFSFARTLAESYKQHHPEHDFLIVLVDRPDGLIPDTLPCGAEVIAFSELRIPDLARFVYRYTVMELNTAVKPYALADLFERRGYETLLYIDPDIWIFRPLTEVYAALEQASVVLTPHMRRPYYDDSHPSDVGILQSGTYNLGFIGLKRGESSRKLLDWWMRKLYRDCVVDIPNGLFVDQKWIDLVPGFFPDHRILHHPAYNAAYWNLHERPLTGADGDWKVDDEPLVFFHFSGYTPIAPHALSKHQNRHLLDAMPELKALTDRYAEALFANGYEESSAWPYAFETLPNGVRLPLAVVRDVMQWAARGGVDTPDPMAEADAFCRFLMSRGVLPNQPRSVLLLHFLLRRRPDVANAFPAAPLDSSDPDFRAWLDTYGAEEESVTDLLPFEHMDEVVDHIADAFHRLRKAGRSDVLSHFRDMWSAKERFDAFADWFATFGVKEGGFSEAHARALREALPGISRILNLYFLRPDLQAAYPAPWEAAQRSQFAHWLQQQRVELELTAEEISLFIEFAAAQRELIEKMCFLYQHFGRPRMTDPSIYATDDPRAGATALETRKMLDWLIEEDAIRPIDHFVGHFGEDWARLEDFGKCSVPGLSPKKNFAFVKAIREAMAADPLPEAVNFAGYLGAPSGMGESARSMLVALRHAGQDVRAVTLPHPRTQATGLPLPPALFGWPGSRAAVSITVANADSASQAERFLPRTYWARKNVGYWVWETEALPPKFREVESRFDEIWTPSHFSAAAIRRTVSRPVRVLPHTLDFAALDLATADRARFGLPQNGTLYGFMFDPQSVLERKNVAGLIRAFRQAFRDDDDCYLVLKVNGKARGAYDYETVRAQAGGGRILFVESTLCRNATFDFMKSLDAYVSLHRSEGFGLTCAEAMALGLPVVATGYSGNLEFMGAHNSLLVPATVVETERPFGTYPAGTRWADPDAEAAAALLRTLLDRERREDLGARARAAVRESLAVERIGELLVQFKDGLLAPGRRNEDEGATNGRAGGEA